MSYVFNKERRFSTELFSSNNEIIRKWNKHQEKINAIHFLSTPPRPYNKLINPPGFFRRLSEREAYYPKYQADLEKQLKKETKERDAFYLKHKADLDKWQEAEKRVQELDELYQSMQMDTFPLLTLGLYSITTAGSVAILVVCMIMGAPVSTLAGLGFAAALGPLGIILGAYRHWEKQKSEQAFERKILEYSDGKRSDLNYYFELKQELFSSQPSEPSSEKEVGVLVEPKKQVKTNEFISCQRENFSIIPSSGVTLFTAKKTQNLELDAITAATEDNARCII